MAEPNVNNVIIGPAIIYVAVTGTAFPSLTTQPAAAAWTTAGFRALGYTEDGVSINSTPAKKDFTPDEAITPIKTIITGVASEIKVTLWEAHLENLNFGMPLTVLTNPGTGIKTLSLGSGNPLAEWAVGIQGAGVGGAASRVVTVWRVNSVSTTEVKSTRKDISKLSCTLTALTDSSKATTRDVWDMVDFGAGS